MSILRTKRVKSRRTTMKAIADSAHRGLPPESELRVYEFGSANVQKKSKDYKGTFNETTGLWE